MDIALLLMILVSRDVQTIVYHAKTIHSVKFVLKAIQQTQMEIVSLVFPAAEDVLAPSKLSVWIVEKAFT